MTEAAGASEAELLELAVAAADIGARELMRRFDDGARPEVRAKSGPTDLVSEADEAAERAIRDFLTAERPGDAVLGEEGGETGEGDLRWVVDPLDGTINYLFGIPTFAVSVACEDADGALAGVVLDPVRDERFTATRSGPAELGDTEIAGSTCAELSLALVATGFAYDVAVRSRQAEVAVDVLGRVRDVRRFGAAALDLCWAACGRVDAYYERGVKPWDVAAGALVARRAGLTVADLPAVDGLPSGIVAAPRAIIDELRGLVEP